MPSRTHHVAARPITALLVVVMALACCACGSSLHTTTDAPAATTTAVASTTATSSTTGTTSTSTTASLPGTGKPPVTIGDKNYTEQFVLGELYLEALQANGFAVQLNQNIGPTDVTMQALTSGRLAMYPEYLNVFNSAVAGTTQTFASQSDAYQAAQRYALAHGLTLLDPTPFSDTDAIGVTVPYATQNGLKTISDLRGIAATLTLGAPPQFEQSPAGLVAIEQTYGVVPAAFKPLDIGSQFDALDKGLVQAADVKSTDGQLASGKYILLADPLNVFGWGNVIPVVSSKVLLAEGPEFAATINAVSALLTTAVIRQLNADVDVSQEKPDVVAKQFLQHNGLVPATG